MTDRSTDPAGLDILEHLRLASVFERIDMKGETLGRAVKEIEQLRGLLHGIATCSHFAACDLCRELIAPYAGSAHTRG